MCYIFLLSVQLLGKLVVLGAFLACYESGESELLSGQHSRLQPSLKSLDGLLSPLHLLFGDDLSSLVEAQVLLHETSFSVHGSSTPDTSHGSSLHLFGYSLGFAGSSPGSLHWLSGSSLGDSLDSHCRIYLI